MAERVFARKLEKVGFTDIWIGDRVAYGIDRAARYPLFTPELIELMREVIPPERQGAVAVSVVVKARKPASSTG
jgi:arsenite methyltransferase